LSTTAELIRERALELGCCAVGFAPADRSSGADRYEAWVDAGMHGTMGWMAERREDRADPRRLVPRASTVVVLAADYHHATNGDGPLEPGHGRVARYARGRDYHNVFIGWMRKLRRFLHTELPGARVYKASDTGPVLERSWAAQAGVAALGKSGNVLNEDQGSWLVLATMVLDRELPPDVPAADLCGECTLCIEICPTGAIIEPGLVDARRCLSYLTIEHRGPVDQALRPHFDEWLFGCDDCQTVCPLSADDRPAGHDSLRPLPGRAAPPLGDLLAESEERFEERLRGSPIRRAGAEGIRRNAALLLGNRPGEGSVAVLRQSLCEDPSPVVRGASAWALGRIGGEGPRAALQRGAAGESEESVRAEIRQAIEGA
jgi:epoxyqueuosine reductase